MEFDIEFGISMGSVTLSKIIDLRKEVLIRTIQKFLVGAMALAGSLPLLTNYSNHHSRFVSKAKVGNHLAPHHYNNTIKIIYGQHRFIPGNTW